MLRRKGRRAAFQNFRKLGCATCGNNPTVVQLDYDTVGKGGDGQCHRSGTGRAKQTNGEALGFRNFFCAVACVDSITAERGVVLTVPAGKVLDNPSVRNADNPVCKKTGGFFFVRYHYDKACPGYAAKQRADVYGIGFVQISCRLVRKNHARAEGKGACNGNALLLSTGQLTHDALFVALHADSAQNASCPGNLFPVCQGEGMHGNI